MADESAARASEVAALFKIHGVDQRSSELVFTHPALDDGGHITLRQDGSNSEDFVPGTSTVIWPCAYSLGDFLCDATVANRESGDAQRDDPSYAANLGAVTPSSVVVEIGAGLGLAGLVDDASGAQEPRHSGFGKLHGGRAVVAKSDVATRTGQSQGCESKRRT